MPSWNPVLGHLLTLDEAYRKCSLPVDLHRHDLFGAMSRDFPQTDGLFYADVWPFINTLLIVTSPLYAVPSLPTSGPGQTRGSGIVPASHHRWKHRFH
jgi:hypothetical protein